VSVNPSCSYVQNGYGRGIEGGRSSKIGRGGKVVRSLGGGKVRASLGGAEALAQRSGFTSSASPPPGSAQNVILSWEN